MEEIKTIIAANIAELRKKQKITQAELAERLNYSDKAVSKWERGESVPDISVLKALAQMFDVSVDYLLTSDHSHYIPTVKKHTLSKRNRNIITWLSASMVLFIATAVFSFLLQVAPLVSYPWMTFVYSLPCVLVVLLVFNCIWGIRKGLKFLYISGIIWSTLLGAYLTSLLYFSFNFWALFIIGVPAQLIVILWSGLKIRKRDENA